MMNEASEGIRIRTLSDLAKLAGVSPGTVSRALAGKELVKKDTRDRIQALAREHGFRPNQIASKLRTQRTGVIGVVIPLGHDRSQHISDPFFMTLLGHLADKLTERGYDLMLSRVIPNDDKDWLDRVALSAMVDGVILIGQSDQIERIEDVARRYDKLVVWGAHENGLNQCVVGTDNVLGGKLACDHLVAAGASNIRFLGDTTGLEIGKRLEGARLAAKSHGVNLVQVPVHLSSQKMGDDIEQWLQGDKGFDGIFAASDLIAMNTVTALREYDLMVPDDIKIVGFDDLPLARQTVPTLTTIRQDIARGAELLVDKLLARIAGEYVASEVISPELIERNSS